MSIDKILKDRYLVVADYPTNEFEVNSILPDDVVFREEPRLKKYPHLFRKLFW